jgi:hypothetical protein
MSIDAISPSLSANLSATLKHDLPDERDRREAAQLTADNLETAQQDATVVTVSDEVLAERRAADDLALRDASEAANSLAASGADRHEAVGSAAHVESSAVQEAVDALLEASRENLDVSAEALTSERDRAADSSASDRDAAATNAEEQEALDVGSTNAGIQNTYGGLPSPTTGDPPLRQPGLSVFA